MTHQAAIHLIPEAELKREATSQAPLSSRLSSGRTPLEHRDGYPPLQGWTGLSNSSHTKNSSKTDIAEIIHLCLRSANICNHPGEPYGEHSFPLHSPPPSPYTGLSNQDHQGSASPAQSTWEKVSLNRWFVLKVRTNRCVKKQKRSSRQRFSAPQKLHLPLQVSRSTRTFCGPSARTAPRTKGSTARDTNRSHRGAHRGPLLGAYTAASCASRTEVSQPQSGTCSPPPRR